VEDCLFLDVWAPYRAVTDPSAAPLPVMVYLHGGGLMEGGRTGEFWRVAAEGEGAVIVSLAYRLNILGFLCTAELSGEQGGASGNYGFMDQQLALQWVQDNIGAFGGDPVRVTLIGHSSGGTSILALLASPASGGLFRAAISLSGSPNITISLADAEAQNAGIFPAAGCGQGDVKQRLACMRSLDHQALLKAIPGEWNTPVSGLFPRFELVTAGGGPLRRGALLTVSGRACGTSPRAQRAR
jgi:para-nitrobenzyl esterase